MVFYFRIIILVSLSFERISFSNGEMGCRVKGDCGSCIQTHGCSWCSRIKNEQEPKPGCFDSSQILDICKKDYEENPKMDFNLTKDLPVRGGKDAIQMWPQEAELKMRTGDEITIGIEFRQAENYPIDLYYLMDFSWTMRTRKVELSKLGNTLAQTMKRISTNFHIGFGSFVDKVTLPYASTTPEDLQNPCRQNNNNQPCITPYSFKNHLQLQNDGEKFSKKVRDAYMSGNYDAPEGVFDALMQAMVCKKEINWREKARHVVVVSTDGVYHMAGDGKLGGIIEPNDGMCHLDKNGYYTHALTLDYPSVSHINKVAMDNNMNIIFAVGEGVENVYKDLTKAIHGSSMGLLGKSENIAQLVTAQYKKISTKIELTDNARHPVYIKYSASCPSGKGWKNESNVCSNVPIGGTAKFKAHIKIADCSEKEYNKQEIKIKPIGINETFTIHFEAICDCECSKPEDQHTEKKSDRCSKSGDLVCGQCKCPPEKIGKKCECDKIGYYHSYDDSTCIARGSTIKCSGLGECKCGSCQCPEPKKPGEIISGDYCECDNFSCEKRNGRLCSGNGKCECKECVCNPGWTGDACDCSLDDRQCKTDESNSEVCSGRGSCECGVCHCKSNQSSSTEDYYSGKYCQICMNCKQECHLYNDCVECLLYKTGPLTANDCSNCTGKFSHDFVDDAKEAQINYSRSSLCVHSDNSGCSFKYIYYYNESEHLIVLGEKKKHCPEEVNLIAVIAGTTGSTVLIGILFIAIWKIWTTIHDRREYEKFENERAKARWGREDNPLYKTAVKTYKNVAYKKEVEQ